MENVRLKKLIQALQLTRFNAIALNPGATLTYLTGMSFHLMERPTLLLATRTGKAAMLLPQLEAQKLTGSPLKGFFYGDNPAERLDALKAVCAYLGLKNGTIGVEPTRMRFLEMSLIQQAVPNIEFQSAEGTLTSLRICKDATEIALMRKAVEIAQAALANTLPAITVGVTEREIAAELVLQMMSLGGDPELPFQPIVSSGPNGANPHATPSEKPLQAGELLVIDWGASYQGYFSDLTRTLAISEVEPEFQKIYELVKQANASARAVAGPGIPAGHVDRAARQVIESAGYGEYFNHRVGHGLGLEAHEEPYMFAENELILQPGMTFTIEPGIYLPNRAGVRIEDDMVITEDGAESLSDFNRSMIFAG